MAILPMGVRSGVDRPGTQEGGCFWSFSYVVKLAILLADGAILELQLVCFDKATRSFDISPHTRQSNGTEGDRP